MTEATTEQDRATFTQRARKALAEHPIPRDHIRALLHQATAIIEAIDATAAAEDDAPWCACGRDVPEGQTLCTRCEMEAWHEEMELCAD